MILWRNIENYPLYHFDSDPRFPPFYYMLGGNLGSFLYGYVSVMLIFAQQYPLSEKTHSKVIISVHKSRISERVRIELSLGKLALHF